MRCKPPLQSAFVRLFVLLFFSFWISHFAVYAVYAVYVCSSRLLRAIIFRTTLYFDALPRDRNLFRLFAAVKCLLICSFVPSFDAQLLNTADEVEKLQEELETMQPLLAQAAEETVETMEKIKVDSVKKHLFLFCFSCCFSYCGPSYYRSTTLTSMQSNNADVNEVRPTL